MPNTGLFSLLARAAHMWPDDTAHVRGSRRLTFAQLKAAADHLAGALRRWRIGPGSKIGLLCPNGPEYVVGSFALFKVDAIVVPIFPGLKQIEIDALDNDLHLDGICYSPEFENVLPKDLRNEAEALHVEEAGMDFFMRRSGRAAEASLADDVLRGETAPLIRFTSGTTSRAKGVIIPQSAMLEYTRRFAEIYRIQRGDCILNLLSMAHIFYQITAGMLCGAKLVVEDAGDASAIARVIDAEKVTHMEAAPSVYSVGVNGSEWRPDQFRGVRSITTCGAPLANNVAAEFRRRFGREIVQRYGLTETGPVLVNTDEDERKRGSLGAPAPGCHVRLKPIGGNPHCAGEIQVRCPGLFAGYYAPPTPRSAVLDDGWFCTGDLAERDADGFFWITGRAKTMINVGAVKVFPSEIEEILLSDSAVREAYVYAAKDARFGEVPHAKVVLQSGSMRTQKELLQRVNRSLSVFKAVRRIEIVSDLAKTPTGKLKRYEIRDI